VRNIIKKKKNVYFSNMKKIIKHYPMTDRLIVRRGYRDTILALKASGVFNSTMSGASRFQSRTVLGKNDIFLVSIREDGIWNDLL
jgi:hypothetical protein